MDFNMYPKIDLNIVDEKTTRYKRTHNTAIAETENQLNSLYNGYRVILCNSGQEATATALDLIQPQTVIVDDETYFETRDWINYRKIKMVQLSDLNNLKKLEKALSRAKKPCVVCGDSPTTFGVWKNVKEISALAHRYGAYVMMDNSIVSLYYSNPIKDGADICVESYTKYVCGYGDVMAGGICLNKSMEWLKDKVVPLSNPGQDSIAWITAHRGNHVSPTKAYMVSRGLQTLEARMRRHTESATLIYETLKEAKVDCAYSGKGGLITLHGLGEEFCHRLKRFKVVGTFGCTYSVADFFRSKERYKQGYCARLSIGLENPHNLIEDVERALGIPLVKIFERKQNELIQTNEHFGNTCLNHWRDIW